MRRLFGMAGHSKHAPLIALGLAAALTTDAGAVTCAGTADSTRFKLAGVSLVNTDYLGEPVLKMEMPPSSFQDPATETLTDRAMLAWLPCDFGDGTIELDLLSTLAPGAPAYARGFIGVGFRIDAHLQFEGLYLRPVNSRVDDQVRRNHTAQYFSYPDHDFARLRREAPETYESYVDVAMQTWIHVKIDVRGSAARLYVNRAAQPTLIVADLKRGAQARGGVGFWIESGTVAYFKNLHIAPAQQSAAGG